jgi:hypothetical protein
VIMETVKPRQNHGEYQLEGLARESQPGEFMLEVHDVAEQRLVGGESREELLHELEVYRGLLRDMGREDLEDDVLDVMDFITGWCAPSARL